jgi:hypothetical protein
VPTLVIAGEASMIPVAAMRHTAEFIPGARLRAIERIVLNAVFKRHGG